MKMKDKKISAGKVTIHVVVHMATVSRMALAAIGLSICHFFKNGHRNNFMFNFTLHVCTIFSHGEH